MATWIAMMRYSAEDEARLASSAVEYRADVVARLEAGGYRVPQWWISADPDWDVLFMVEADHDPARDAKFQMTVKGTGVFQTGRLIPVVTAEDFDAA